MSVSNLILLQSNPVKQKGENEAATLTSSVMHSSFVRGYHFLPQAILPRQELLAHFPARLQAQSGYMTSRHTLKSRPESQDSEVLGQPWDCWPSQEVARWRGTMGKASPLRGVLHEPTLTTRGFASLTFRGQSGQGTSLLSSAWSLAQSSLPHQCQQPLSLALISPSFSLLCTQLSYSCLANASSFTFRV